MIQDAAAKCRYCGEWLDPSQRPAWSDASASQTGSLLPPQDANAEASGGREDDADQALRQRRTQIMSPAPGSPGPGGGGAPEGPPGGWNPPTWSGNETEIPAEAATGPAGAVDRNPAPALGIVDVTAGSLTSLEDVTEQREGAANRNAGLHPVVGRSSDSEESGMVVPVMQGRLGATGQDVAARLAQMKDAPAAVERALDPPAIVDPLQPPAPAEPVEPQRTDPPEPETDSAGSAEAKDRAQEPPSPQNDAPAEPPRGRADELAAGFLGEDDDEDDDGDVDDGFEAGAPKQPLPWKAIGLSTAVLGATVFLAFQIVTGGDEPAKPSLTESLAQVGKAPAAPEPAPAADAAQPPAENVAGAGQPAVPEAGTPTAPAAADPNAPVDPNAVPVDPNTPPADPNTAPADPNGAPADPNAAAAPPAADDPALQEKIEAARKNYKRGRLTKAKATLEEVLAASPQHPDGLLIMAQVQLEQGKMDDSLATATKCTQVKADLADCWLTLGVLYQAKKDKDQAKAAYEKYLALAPKGLYARDAKSQLRRLNR